MAPGRRPGVGVGAGPSSSTATLRSRGQHRGPGEGGRPPPSGLPVKWRQRSRPAHRGALGVLTRAVPPAVRGSCQLRFRAGGWLAGSNGARRGPERHPGIPSEGSAGHRPVAAASPALQGTLRRASPVSGTETCFLSLLRAGRARCRGVRGGRTPRWSLSPPPWDVSSAVTSQGLGVTLLLCLL